MHVPRSLSISDEVEDAFMERPYGKRNVANDVYWHAVEHAQDQEESQVKDQFEKVCRALLTIKGKIGVPRNSPVVSSK